MGPASTVTAAVPAESLAAVRTILAAEGMECALVPVPTDGCADRLAGVGFLVLDHERTELLPALSRLPALRVVQVLVVGTEWVRPFLPPGMLLGRPVGARDTAVAEWVASALLGIASGLLPARRVQHEEGWRREPSRELRGQRIVVVGQGTTGRATADLLAVLGVEVVRVAAHARPGVYPGTALPELVEDADAVVLLVPDTAATAGMVDAALLARMRTGAVVVNAARGRAVVTDALVAELRTGRLQAVLDVTDPEPLPPGHPLWRLPGCHISPHVAGATHEAREHALRCAAEQLVRYVRGRELVAVERT